VGENRDAAVVFDPKYSRALRESRALSTAPSPTALSGCAERMGGKTALPPLFCSTIAARTGSAAVAAARWPIVAILAASIEG
jgi:hypothetical protein